MTKNEMMLEQDRLAQGEEKGEQGRELTLEGAEQEYQRLFGIAMHEAGLG